MTEHVNKIDQTIEAIDECLNSPVISIEEALAIQVLHEKLTPDEAKQILEAYQNSFKVE